MSMLLSSTRRISGLALASKARPASVILSRSLWAHTKPPETPDEALQYLREGNRRFVDQKLQPEHPSRGMDRVKHVAAGQKPYAAFLSCADSRVPVEIIFDQGFGDIFVTRVAGNIVTTEITGSLEFGALVLGAKVLMVLGHSSCGAVSATISGAPVPGVISSLYYNISPAVAKCGEPGHKHGPQCSHLDMAIEENVKYQVSMLKVSPVLTNLVKEGKLKIIGGVYDLATGKVTEVA